MIDGEDGCAQNNKGDPSGYIDHIQTLKKRKSKPIDCGTKSTEQENDAGNDRGGDLVAPQFRFLFFLVFLSLFSQFSPPLTLGTP